jgi:hypothetical protein
VTGHDETGHDLALDDVALHDFRHVGFGFDLIPHAFGIDHNTRPFGTVIEAPGFIGTYDVFQVQPLRFLLEAGVESLRSKLGATPTGIVGAPLVCTDEDMTGKCGHQWFLLGLHRGGLHAGNELCDIGCGQERGAARRSVQNRRDLSQP